MSITDRLTRMLAQKPAPLKLADLPLSQAFSYIASQDPNVSLRFYIPVPNWLDILDPVDYPAVRMTPKGEYRFHFRNEVDKRTQAVRVDGTGVVIINGIKPDQAKDLLARSQPLLECGLDPSGLEDILAYARDRLGLVDFYHGSEADVRVRMHPHVGGTYGVLGAWLPNAQESSAIYIPGESRVDLIGGGTQNYTNGAYVTIPSVPSGEVTTQDVAALAAVLIARKITPRAVEASVFEAQNTTPDGRVFSQGAPKP